MRSVRALLSASVGVVNQVTRAVLSLIVRRVFFIYISAEFLGLNSLFGSIVSFLGLSELGIASAVTICLYKPLAENDFHRANAYIHLLKIYNYIMMAIVLLGGIILTPIVFSTVNGDYSTIAVLESYVLYLIGTACSYLWSYCEILLVADQKQYKVTAVYWINTVIVNLVQIGIIVFCKNYYLYLCTVILYNFLSHYFIRKIAEKEYPWLNEEADLLTKNDKTDFAHKIKDLFLYRIATYLIQSLDNIIVSMMLGTVVVAYYGNYYLIVNMLIAIVGNIGGAAVAGLGNVFYVDENKKMFETTKNLLFIQQMIFSSTAVAMIVLANDFVRICFGEESVCSINLVISLAILYYIQGVTSPLENVRTAVGCYDDKYWQFMVSVLNVVISVALTLKIGLCGVVIGTIVCYFIKGFILTPRLIFGRAISKDYKKEYMKNVGYACSSFCVGLIVAYLMPVMEGLPFVLAFVIKGVLAVIGVTLINIILLHRTRFYQENKSYFMKLISIWLDKLKCGSNR